MAKKAHSFSSLLFLSSTNDTRSPRRARAAFLRPLPRLKVQPFVGVHRGGSARPPAADATLLDRGRPPPPCLLPKRGRKERPGSLCCERPRGDAVGGGLCALGVDARGQVGVPGPPTGEAAEASSSSSSSCGDPEHKYKKNEMKKNAKKKTSKKKLNFKFLSSPCILFLSLYLFSFIYSFFSISFSAPFLAPNTEEKKSGFLFSVSTTSRKPKEE